MNILKKQQELVLRKETERRIATAPAKKADAQTTNVLIKHMLKNSNLFKACRDIKLVDDTKTVTVATTEHPRSIYELTTVVPKRYAVQVSYDPTVHIHELSASIGRQMARVIDDSIEERRYYASTLVFVDSIETATTLDIVSGEKILQIFFKFSII